MEYVKVVYVPMAIPMSIKHRSQQVFILYKRQISQT